VLKSILILIILSFFLGTAAWLFFIWAVKKGSFDDMEGPKYRMLEDDDEVEGPGQNNDTNNDKLNL
jgi:cbb3-type cytochrome oxidase maturation protein